MSPHKCSLLMKFKSCSLSVTVISAWVGAETSRGPGKWKKKKSCLKLWWFSSKIAARHVHIRDFPPLMSSTYVMSFSVEDISQSLWHIVGTLPPPLPQHTHWTPEGLSVDKTAGHRRLLGPVHLHIWSCLWLWFWLPVRRSVLSGFSILFSFVWGYFHK